MKELLDLIKKKKEMQGEMSPEQKKAKMGVIGELRDMANKEIGKDIPSLKKVMVASPSEEGLQEGLDKAQEIIGEPGEEEKPEEDAMEGGEKSELVSPQELMDVIKNYSPEEKMKLMEMLKS